jgi:RNA polymerase sigma factor (sigma-70 family)
MRMSRGEIEGILIAAVRSVYRKYPSCEWDDLVSQAWLIVTERIEGYDKSKGTSLSTYVYNTISHHLSNYVCRVVLKELNLNGRRIHVDGMDCNVSDCTSQVEARDIVEKLYAGVSGVSRDILLLMEEGYTQGEVAEELGISRQRVSKCIQGIREVVEWN